MIIALSGKIGAGKDEVGAIIQYLVSMSKDSQFSREDGSYNNFKEKAWNEQSLSGWEIKKFAGKLKQIVCLLLGCTMEQLEDRDFKEKELGEEWWYYKFGGDEYTRSVMIPFIEAGYEDKLAEPQAKYLVKMTPRVLLQLLGTEAGRQIIHPNIWVNALFADYIFDTGFEYPVKVIEGDPLTGKAKLKVTGNPEPYNNGYPKWIITDCRFPNEANTVKEKGGLVIRVNRSNNGLACAGDLEENMKTNFHPSETALDSYNQFDYIIDNSGSLEDLIEKVREILQKEKII